jgi:hypothetical protein
VPETLSVIIAVGLAIVHLIAGKLRFPEVTPRSIWLSSAGGVSVATSLSIYFPNWAEAQAKFRKQGTGWLAEVELHVWLLALAGLASFYGLGRLVKQHRRRNQEEREATEDGVFWIHTASFAAYNVLFGYLLVHREEPGMLSLSSFGLAIGLHFLVTDFGLRQDHNEKYDRLVRWILAASVLAGFILGRIVTLHELGTSALFAFLAGGIVLTS